MYQKILFHVEIDIIKTFPIVSIVAVQKTVDEFTEIEQRKQILRDTHRRSRRNYKTN